MAKSLVVERIEGPLSQGADFDDFADVIICGSYVVDIVEFVHEEHRPFTTKASFAKMV